MDAAVGAETEGVPLVDGRRLVLTKDPKRKRYRRSAWTWKTSARKAEAWAFDGKDIIGGPVSFIKAGDTEVRIPIRRSGTVGAIVLQYSDSDTQIFPVSWPVAAGDVVHFTIG